MTDTPGRCLAERRMRAESWQARLPGRLPGIQQRRRAARMSAPPASLFRLGPGGVAAWWRTSTLLAGGCVHPAPGLALRRVGARGRRFAAGRPGREPQPGRLGSGLAHPATRIRPIWPRSWTAVPSLRTHVLRPTWHFVRAEDVGWLLDLTGPRVRRVTGQQLRDAHGLDERSTDQALAAVTQLLASRGQLTRAQLAARTARARRPGQWADADDPAGPRRAERADLQRTSRRRPAHLRAHGRTCAGTAPARADRGPGRARLALLHRARPGDRTGPGLLGDDDPHRRARRPVAGP